MAPASVIVLTNHSASLNTRCANQSLLEFLYQLYTSFNLEANPFETLISPNDEEAILQLVISDGHSSGKVPSFFVHQLWPELCRRRLGLSETSAEDAALQQNVAQFMRSCNLIDRVHLLYSLLQEFASDTTLKEAVFGATYVVTSPLLSWFEWLVVFLLIQARVSSLRFECFPSSNELPLFHLQQCHLVRESFLPMDQIQRTLLAYLSVAVNVKNTLDLALVINRPFRGFGRSFFSTLRRVAKKTGILPGQVVISFPACMTESAATSTVKEDGRLVPYAAALNHLADTIRACQDALSGFSAEDESGASCAMAASCSATSSMSPLAALQAIEACLTVAAKTFSKPPPQLPSIRTGALSASSAPKWPITAVKNAKLALIGRLRLLFERQSEQQELIATPNRPASSGGSVQGRAAFKWARLFLVSEAASILGNPSSPSLSSPKTPSLVRRSSNETPTNFPKTPSSVTATRSTLTAFFLSPSTPGVAVTRGGLQRNPQSPLSANGTSASPQHNGGALQPRRPVNARFQTNLDWATTTDSPSPVSSSKTSWSSVLFGEESQSSNLPPTSFFPPSNISVPTSPQLSSHVVPEGTNDTSVIKSVIPEKRPRYLFPDAKDIEKCDMLNPTKRQILPKTATTSKRTSEPRSKSTKLCGKQGAKKQAPKKAGCP
uniref:PCNA-interacting partner n=1 Tax=Schistocephalus solidus TaxID=70667 RepID=A0A0V0J6W0_SCHSO